MTTELIKITIDDHGRQSVLGRELHTGLEVGTAYDVWFKRMVEYGFEEGKDYSSILMDRSDNLPGKPRTDHILSLDMAKHLAMIQRSEKGKRIRQYFIEAEKRFVDGLAIAGPEQHQARLASKIVGLLSDKTYSVSVTKAGTMTIRVPGAKSPTKRGGTTAKEGAPVFPQMLEDSAETVVDAEIVPLETLAEPKPLTPPVIEKPHTTKHFEALARFLNERCIAGPVHEVPALELWDAWEKWCVARQEYYISERAMFFRCVVSIMQNEPKRLKRVQRYMQPKAKCGKYVAYDGLSLRKNEG